MTAFTFDLPQDESSEMTSNSTSSASLSQELPVDLQPDHSPDIQDVQRSKLISLRMPTDLVERLDTLAKQEDISRSQAMRRITSYVLYAIRNDNDALIEYGRVARHLYGHACKLVSRERNVSVSLLQRHLRLDYHIAVLLMDDLERSGVVTPADENGRRVSMIVED